MHTRPALAIALILTAVPILAQENSPLLSLASYPSEVRVHANSVAVLTITVSNGGSETALNTLLHLLTTGCSEISTDGLVWRKNMSFKLGNLRVGESFKQLIFVRNCVPGNATLIATAFAENHDPVVLSVAVYFIPSTEEKPVVQLIHAAALAVLALLIATVFLLFKRKIARKREVARKRGRA